MRTKDSVRLAFPVERRAVYAPTGPNVSRNVCAGSRADLEALQENADTARAMFATGPPPTPKLPTAFYLGQNHPNPATTSTRIAFACPRSARVELAVYDVAGRRVATLADGVYGPGTHEVEWNPAGLGPGVYLYALEAPAERLVKTMVVAP